MEATADLNGKTWETAKAPLQPRSADTSSGGGTSAGEGSRIGFRVDTRITQLLGIDHPILLGGMMHLSDAKIVAAVVNAGAMGFITPRSFATLKNFQDELRLCHTLTGGKPFGVNLTFAGRAAHNSDMLDHIRVARDQGVRFFESAGRSPEDVVRIVHDAGGLLIHKCPSVRHALTAERLGVDAIALVGMEEGGHPGANRLSTFVSGAFARERLGDIPLVLGGGIGCGRQVAAALALGADGVVMGSRFMAAAEIWAHDALKARIIASDELASTTIMEHLSTWRVMANEAARAAQELERKSEPTHADYGDLILSARTRERVYVGGDPDGGIVSFGPGGAFAQQVEPAGDIISALMRDAVEALQAASLRISESSPAARS